MQEYNSFEIEIGHFTGIVVVLVERLDKYIGFHLGDRVKMIK